MLIRSEVIAELEQRLRGILGILKIKLRTSVGSREKAFLNIIILSEHINSITFNTESHKVAKT